MKKKVNIVGFLTIFLFSACATYYQKSYEFQEAFSLGNLEQAKSFLEKNKKAAKKKDRLLYFLDRGVVEQMLGNFQESNYYFEEAYLYNEDYKKSLSDDMLSYVANPMLKPYVADNFEKVLLHYYKAINYINLRDMDAALVEIRRINIKLNTLNDKTEDKKRLRYKQDAFGHNLMGIVYEAKGELNNAFIAYRNALEIYEADTIDYLNAGVPKQLEEDILRTVNLLGFSSEIKYFEKKFNTTYQEPLSDSSLVLFWLNGLGPVKGEFSLNLSTIKGEGGYFTFANEAEGFNIPYTETPQYQSNDNADFSDISLLRMAIPKYRDRMPIISSAYVLSNNESFSLEKAEDIGNIAKASLKDRLLKELTNSVGRLALKKLAEELANEKNEDIGSLVSLVNAFTEKADTRNWQTLPNSIYYSRIPICKDQKEVSLITNSEKFGKDTILIKIPEGNARTKFATYHSLESYPPANN